MIIEGDNPAIDTIPEAGPASEVDQAVARLVVPEILDGACLQLGIGGMPNAIGEMIAKSDLKDLGVHTEMYVDAYVAMAEAGKITGARKNIDVGRQTYAFAAGSKRLYDYIDNNPELYNETIDYIAALEHKGKAFVIRPSAPLNIGSTSHDITQMERVYQEGRRVGRYHLAAMKRFIEKAEVE